MVETSIEFWNCGKVIPRIIHQTRGDTCHMAGVTLEVFPGVLNDHHVVEYDQPWQVRFNLPPGSPVIIHHHTSSKLFFLISHPSKCMEPKQTTVERTPVMGNQNNKNNVWWDKNIIWEQCKVTWCQISFAFIIAFDISETMNKSLCHTVCQFPCMITEFRIISYSMACFMWLGRVFVWCLKWWLVLLSDWCVLIETLNDMRTFHMGECTDKNGTFHYLWPPLCHDGLVWVGWCLSDSYARRPH